MPCSETLLDIMQRIFVSTVRSNHKMPHCALVVSILKFNTPKFKPGTHVAHHRCYLIVVNSLFHVNFCPFPQSIKTAARFPPSLNHQSKITITTSQPTKTHLMTSMFTGIGYRRLIIAITLHTMTSTNSKTVVGFPSLRHQAARGFARG